MDTNVLNVKTSPTVGLEYQAPHISSGSASEDIIAFLNATQGQDSAYFYIFVPEQIKRHAKRHIGNMRTFLTRQRNEIRKKQHKPKLWSMLVHQIDPHIVYRGTAGTMIILQRRVGPRAIHQELEGLL